MKLPLVWRRVLQLCGMVFALSGPGLAQQISIVNSPHNLSASGPGSIRATTEQQVCIFCHTPHNASPVQPLWNRNVPVNAYIVYSSTSLQAKPGQPTGSSKLCLSCHDGTIAVGSVLSREQPIAMAGGTTTLPPGHGNLGTDLSDDHPISFRYDAALSTQDTKIKNPAVLPTAIKLDRNDELQCTSCHDAHNDFYGKFLVMDNTSSQLCNSCHQVGITTIPQHETCESCHQMHSAPSGALLLKGINATDACLTCHNSGDTTMQGANIASDMNKFSRHMTQAAVPMSQAHVTQIPGTPADIDVTCASCHEPHTMQIVTATAPLASPKLGKVSGVSSAGIKVPAVQFEYEVCYKCHMQQIVGSTPIPRQIVQSNTRLKFDVSAVSFHPVEIVGKNTDVPSLRVGLTAASMIYCSDCHASDTSKVANFTGANGPHGSSVPFLLAGRYETTDNTTESAAAYELCYRCHDRTSILSDQTFTSHKKHIVDFQTPCSVCHDAHGISSLQGSAASNSHLINFDTRVVQPDPATGLMEYRSLGMRTGQCTLTCHGAPHSPLAYPQDVTPGLGPASIRANILRRPSIRAPIRSGAK